MMTVTIDVYREKNKLGGVVLHFLNLCTCVCFRQMNISRYFHYSDSDFHCIIYFDIFLLIFNR